MEVVGSLVRRDGARGIKAARAAQSLIGINMGLRVGVHSAGGTATIRGILAHIEATRDNGARTRNARLAAIKSFMRFVEHRVPSILEQSLRILAIPSKKFDMPLIRYLSIVEMEAILNAPDLRTRSGIRDRAMLHLGFGAGLRVSELTGLLLTGVTLQPTPTVCVMGKGRKQRSLPLWKQTAADIRAWLAVRDQSSAPELFLNGATQGKLR